MRAATAPSGSTVLSQHGAHSSPGSWVQAGMEESKGSRIGTQPPQKRMGRRMPVL